VKIVTQTGSSHRSSLLGGWLAAALALLDPAAAEAQSGEIRCGITENGIPAHGTIVIEREGRKIGGGPCGQAISVPEGKCTATVRLDGPLDNPSKSVEVRVVAGKVAPVTVDFQTGVLEVRIEAKGQGGTGMVTLNRGSKRIGTLASGVATRLSAGSYEIVVRLGGQERRYAIDLRAGQRRVVRAQF
jgi:hypothetical protein